MEKESRTVSATMLSEKNPYRKSSLHVAKSTDSTTVSNEEKNSGSSSSLHVAKSTDSLHVAKSTDSTTLSHAEKNSGSSKNSPLQHGYLLRCSTYIIP